MDNETNIRTRSTTCINIWCDPDQTLGKESSWNHFWHEKTKCLAMNFGNAEVCIFDPTAEHLDAIIAMCQDAKNKMFAKELAEA